jgi:hypothetical protein
MHAGLTCASVVFAPSPCESIEGKDFALYGLVGGAWGKHSTYFVLEFLDGTVWDKDFRYHLAVLPHAPDDPVTQKGETVGNRGLCSNGTKSWEV